MYLSFEEDQDMPEEFKKSVILRLWNDEIGLFCKTNKDHVDHMKKSLETK